MAMPLNCLKKTHGFLPYSVNHKILGNLYKINTNTTKNGIITEIINEKESYGLAQNIDPGNIEYKYCSYLKPMDIKGIKRADRKFDYNSSYVLMKKQNDFKDDLNKANLLTTYLYNGMKIPLPPKRYKLSEYVDIRIDMFSPIIVCSVICLPFFFTGFMWSVPQGGSGH
ncbi:conserved Plasmodium protein, unknown function [Plasmodium berghei]|uniref:Uncharacterized protein n=2 Tax=Plasmodium berghei TaxID=5821 RepID=A0A509AXH0_PLABA|nr:conserved Plasmodium protein, unknown function [Plasmodium berghei ANKA]CXI99044.1 conserved Plasmodium protein, unknown function [Plasmodium berghei]SCL97798.1 conserved Plasmodium protein, unknown function [Plasmodium berghei]SCM16684.1 conserved Plasmodium protein, unknown function [Plasmodium berghei]SCM18482.1 conserved Plasmodium protein, unknown function [Plasmodium berghei]SCN27915.1 conserved Plasmodium protein, unknown function [Plasmodium berghei]|eukprot:XP_034423567.1 conserved Plasmodium protein, unknown function [Plasmodium berghei ANKA]